VKKYGLTTKLWGFPFQHDLGVVTSVFMVSIVSRHLPKLYEACNDIYDICDNLGVALPTLRMWCLHHMQKLRHLECDVYAMWDTLCKCGNIICSIYPSILKAPASLSSPKEHGCKLENQISSNVQSLSSLLIIPPMESCPQISYEESCYAHTLLCYMPLPIET
jgi:hypothetical protein